MSTLSAKCGLKTCSIVGLVKSETLDRVTPHRWEFHLLAEEKSCQIRTCPEFGTVAHNYSTYKAHLDAHNQNKYKGVLLLCPVEDCPMRESKENFETQQRLKIHQWNHHLPIEKKSCRMAACHQFGIDQGNQWRLLAHTRAHQQGTKLVRKRKPERESGDSSEGEGGDGSVSNSPCLQAFL